MKLKEYVSNRGIGVSLALAFSALSVLLTLILVEVIGGVSAAQEKSNIGNGLAQLAHHTSVRLDRSMFERYREVRLMAQRADLVSPDSTPEDRRRILESIQETYPYYAWIGMTDNDGKVLAASKGLLEGVDVSERPWFRNALKGVYLGDVHDAKLLAKLLPDSYGEPVRLIDIAFPYNGKAGEPAGVISMHLSWLWAKDVEKSVMEPIDPERNIQFALINANREVLLGPPELKGKQFSSASLKEAQRGGSGFRLETWPDGRRYLVGYSASKGYGAYPGLGWTVLVRQSVDDAFQPIKHIQRRVLWSGIAIAVLFSVLGLFAARRISQPLLALAQSAQRIEKGEAIDIPTNASSYFEVKALAHSLTSLVSNLLQKESALKELNFTLEKRVEERTQELEQALAAAEESRSRIKSIIDTTQDAFIGINLHGEIVHWNSMAEKMFGWSRHEALGMSWLMLTPERFRSKYENMIRTFHVTSKLDALNRRLERLVVTRNGDEFPVELSLGLIETNGAYFFSAFLHDISDRKEVERMKNEFISTVSHELRTPLTSIRGSLGLLSAGMAGEFPPQARKLLDIANKNCERLVRMINNMLDIEKMESGGMRFEMVRQPLLPLVQQAVDATQGYASQFNVTLELQPSAADIHVVVDRDRITQVLINLLSNAIKFSPAGGVVLVRVGAGATRARLSVTDRGAGIPEEFRTRIFQKFAQVDSSDSRQKGGTGLGLAICKLIVEEHQGYIDFQSEVGRGTEFYVSLPIASQPAAAHA